VDDAARDSVYRDCIRKLKDYIYEATRTCDMLNRITSSPLSAKERHQILEQRKKESDALERYHLARQRLFDAVSQDKP
jgi:hypothetical protein